MDQRVDASRHQVFAVHLFTKVEGNAQVAFGRAPREPHDRPARACEVFRQSRTDKARGASDGDPGLPGVSHAAATAPIRCALAITLNVIVVAGRDGKTLASTTCTRDNPSTLPHTSVSNCWGRSRIGNVPPV